jgi:tape measure domain-containing protein
MVTENVNVRFRESGARVIKRRIDEIGESANRATRGIFLLQRALFVIGGAGIARGLQRYADALTNVENRLRLTTESTANLEAVQTELFDVARRSRTGFQATADVYNRIALSARNLGVGQQQILNVTETLQQAAIISGASAREANAALVQLGQGIASDRLSGDELRSVLEQLPAVADIIVDYLNQTGEFGEVTRGTLRELGREGKLTAETVFRAIETAQGNISALFAETQPTIEQAFQIAETNFLQFLDTFDDFTGISGAIANAIIKLSENFDVLLAAVGAVAVALTGLFTQRLLAGIVSYVGSVRNAGVALTRYRSIAAATATVEATARAGRVADLTARQAELAQTLASARAKLAENAATAQQIRSTFASKGARDLETNSYISNQAAVSRLVASQQALATSQARVNALTRLQAANTAALTAAQSRAAQATAAQAAAQAAQSGIVARLTATFPTLAGAIRLALGALRGLFALMAANPIGAVITAIGLLTVGVFTLGDRFKVTEDGVVSFKDAAIAAFQLVTEWVGRVVSALREQLGPVITFASEAFTTLGEVANTVLIGLGQIFLNIFNGLVGTVVGFVNGTIRAWDLLPAALIDIMNIARNGILTVIENIVNGFIDGVRKIPEFFSSAMDKIVQFGRDAVQFIGDAFNALPGAIRAIAEEAGRVLLAAFTNAVNGIKRLLNTLPGIALNVGEDMSTAFENVDLGLPELPSFDGFIEDGRLTLDRFRGEVTGAAREVGTIYAEEFSNAYNRNFAGEAGQAIIDASERIGGAIIDRARENIASLEEGNITDSEIDPNRPSAGGTGSGSGSGNSRDFATELAQLQQQIELERQYGIQKEITNNILSIERAIKRELTAVEAEQVARATELLEISRIQGEVLQEILGPQETLRFTQAALNELFAEGAITLEQYNTKLRETQIAADRAANTLGGGFRAAIASSIQSAGQFGETLGNFVVGAAGKAADAIVEFAKTGQFNIRQFFQDLFAQLLKLAAQRLLLQFLGGFLGIPGGGLVGFSQGGSILPSFAGGGSINPTGPGSTDSQVVAFNKRPDERVDILTPGQQAAQRNNMNGGGGSTTVNNTTNVAAVISPNDIVNAFDGAEGETVVVNMIQRNASTVRQIVQG